MFGPPLGGSCRWSVTSSRFGAKVTPVSNYRLFNDRSANLVGSYDTEEEALQAVAEGVRHHGTIGSARHLTLQRHIPGRADEPVASGEALPRRAIERFPHRKTA